MTASLRIGVDGDALRTPLAGVGQYVHQLLQALLPLLPEAEIVLYSRLPAHALALPSSPCTVRREPNPAWRRVPSFAWLKTRGAALARADALDVFWAPRTLHPRLPPPVRTVATVHDLNHLVVPQTMHAATRWSHALWFRGDALRADAVVANSEGTAARLRALLGVRAHAVVAPGVGPRFRPCTAAERPAALAALEALGVRPPYLLSVATLEPRKNVSLVARAFVALRRRGELAGWQLVLAGARGWRDDALLRELQAAREYGVVVPGFVADQTMPALYALARALVCPSRYEGFGMPVLEARTCGTPVLVSDVPELREAGGERAIVVEPTLDAWREALRQAVHVPRHIEPDLAERCGWHRRARDFAVLLRALAAGREAARQPAAAAVGWGAE